MDDDFLFEGDGKLDLDDLIFIDYMEEGCNKLKGGNKPSQRKKEIGEGPIDFLFRLLFRKKGNSC